VRFVADVHLHSRHSRATSKELNPENLFKWSALKGVNVVGTADFTHPEWLAELKEKLEPAEEGLFRLKPEVAAPVEAELPNTCRGAVRFLLSVEISSIYKKNDRTRKVHNVVILPDFASADELNRRLGAIGNLKSDGRPILGLDSRDLLEICLEVCEDVLFIPAHIWTPHFAALGSSSGFDSLEECYEELLPHIPAVETGLSSDPPMNRRLSALDRFAVVSNSDAHSPRKLAREATCFDTELSYPGILSALRDRDPKRFTGTLEFYPEEGKYHYDGHRKCGVCWKPEQTLAAAGLCPECGRKLTVGVLHRVEKLADRPEGVDAESESRPEFEYLIPLAEVISSSVGVGPNSKKVQTIYHALLGALGPELDVLRMATPDEIAACGQLIVAEGVRRMRAGQVHIEPGFDGEFGRIQVFSKEELVELEGQGRLFEMPREVLPSTEEIDAAAVVQEIATDPGDGQRVETLLDSGEAIAQLPSRPGRVDASGGELDEEQWRAVTAKDGPVVVVAGPGSGKTRTLTHRIAYLILQRGVDPGRITAVTFTNRAAGEMVKRLSILLPATPGSPSAVRVGTFHRLALDLTRLLGRTERPVILDALEAREVLTAAIQEASSPLQAASAQEQISRLKADGLSPEDVAEDGEAALAAVYRAYQERLSTFGACDFDDILLDFLKLLEADAAALARVREHTEYLLVDEFQDVNAVQYRLVKLMAGQGSGLFVIGDPNQAIYGFRGADPGYFQSLRQDFPAACQVKLGRNYRSEEHIIRAAAGVIGSGDGLRATRVAVGLPGPSLEEPAPHPLPATASLRIRLLTAASELAEGIAVVREVSRLVGGSDMNQADLGTDPGLELAGKEGQYAFGDIAVLFRTGRQAEVLEECFLKEGLPYRLIGQRGFMEAASVRQALAFCRYLTERPSIWRLLEAVRSGPFQIGQQGRAMLLECWMSGGARGVELTRLSEEIPGRERKALQALAEAAKRYRPFAQESRPDDLLRQWQAEYGGEKGEDDDAFGRLIDVAAGADYLEGMLNTVLLGQEADLERSGNRFGTRSRPRGQIEAVRLMTMHAAKGLEFPVVLICGVEDGLVPLTEEGRAGDEEEERRLLYVALTRAREEVVMFRARSRMRHGKRLTPEVSRFVNNIPVELLLEMEADNQRRERSHQLSLF
jgi:uncharacterized protein (TIGR00375 family)